MKTKFQKGFTLVELLVVVALIGILAAVAIMVINPAKLSDRTKDATVEATMDKIGLAASGIAASDDNQYFPTCAILTASLKNVTTACSATTPPVFALTVGSVITSFTYGGYGTVSGCISAPSLVDATKFIKWCSTTGKMDSAAAAACTTAGC